MRWFGFVLLAVVLVAVGSFAIECASRQQRLESQSSDLMRMAHAGASVQSIASYGRNAGWLVATLRHTDYGYQSPPAASKSAEVQLVLASPHVPGVLGDRRIVLHVWMDAAGNAVAVESDDQQTGP